MAKTIQSSSKIFVLFKALVDSDINSIIGRTNKIYKNMSTDISSLSAGFVDKSDGCASTLLMYMLNSFNSDYAL